MKTAIIVIGGAIGSVLLIAVVAYVISLIVMVVTYVLPFVIIIFAIGYASGRWQRNSNRDH